MGVRMHVRDNERKKKYMHAHNFENKNIIVSKLSSKSKSDCTVVFVLIKASKKDLTPLCFNDILFFEKKYLFMYSNLLMMFAKIAYGFT